MALERTLFLRQQADLIAAQRKLRESADLVTQPGQISRVTQLITEASLAMSTSENKELQGQATLKELNDSGFRDIPLNDFATRLRERPPTEGEGAIARIISETGLREDGEAVAASELATEALRNGDRPGYREALQLADQHIGRAEAIAHKGNEIIDELGDIPLVDLIQDISPAITQPVQTTENGTGSASRQRRGSPQNPDQSAGEKMRRGERMLKSITAAFSLDEQLGNLSCSVDDLVIQIYNDRAINYPNIHNRIATFKGNTRNDLKRAVEILESEEELEKALMNSDIKEEFKTIQNDPRVKTLTTEEKLTLVLRESGWQEIWEKMHGAEQEPQPEQEPDFMNTPMAVMMEKIRSDSLEYYKTGFNMSNLQPIIDITAFQERVYLRASELRVRNHQFSAFRNESQDDVIYDIHNRRINKGEPIPDPLRNETLREIDDITKGLALALQYYALGKNVPSKLEDRFLRFLDPTGNPEHYFFFWLSPNELGQVMRREIDFQTASRLREERSAPVITPEQGRAFLLHQVGED